MAIRLRVVLGECDALAQDVHTSPAKTRGRSRQKEMGDVAPGSLQCCTCQRGGSAVGDSFFLVLVSRVFGS